MHQSVWGRISSITSVDDPEQENQSDIDRICPIESYCPGMEKTDFFPQNSQILTKSNEIE